MARILFQTRSGSLSDGLKGRLKTPRKAETMKPKSLYRAALLEYLYCASFAADPAEASAAYRSYRQLAEKGCPDGWFGLGRARQYGYGVKPNPEKAEKYYRRAAKNGHADAQRALGYCYEKGLGLPENHAKARKWYARAALQADATACNNMGFLYYNGKGVRRSKSLAKKWYKLAARAGSILALSNLGVLYEDAGRLKKAVRYYRRAAEAGNKYAAKQLKRLDK